MTKTEQRSYWIIVHPKTGRVWARNGVHFWSYEEAKAELDTQAALHGGMNGWVIEQQEYWTKKDSDDF